MSVSVIICCFNSAIRLPKTLECLAGQLDIMIPWEVVIVDNNSSDNTCQVAISEWARYNLAVPLNIVKELNPGLSSARKTGVLASQHDFVLFCDDDNWLCDSYIKTAYDWIKRDNLLSALGGKGEPIFETQEPKWFNKVARSYALGPQENSVSLYGAGLLVRKKILQNLYILGFESLLADRSGTSLSSGGDFEIVYLFQIVGYKVQFVSNLTFKHFLPKERLKLKYLNKLYKAFGEASPILECYLLSLTTVNQNPKKFWFKSFFKIIFFTPLIYVFGKSRPRNTFLIMNFASIRSFWRVRKDFVKYYDYIDSIRVKYNERYPNKY